MRIVGGSVPIHAGLQSRKSGGRHDREPRCPLGRFSGHRGCLRLVIRCGGRRLAHRGASSSRRRRGRRVDRKPLGSERRRARAAGSNANRRGWTVRRLCRPSAGRLDSVSNCVERNACRQQGRRQQSSHRPALSARQRAIGKGHRQRVHHDRLGRHDDAVHRRHRDQGFAARAAHRRRQRAQFRRPDHRRLRHHDP